MRLQVSPVRSLALAAMESGVDVFATVPKFGLPPQEGVGGPQKVATRLRCLGAPPSARGGHTATLVGSKVFVFGGHELRGAGQGFIYHNSVHVLDLKEMKWVAFQRHRGTPPPPRYGHTANLQGSQIVIFGGKGGPNVYFKDLHALDVETGTWYRGPSRPGDPAARFWHSSDMLDEQMFVFGGIGEGGPLGDLHMLDLRTMQWLELHPKGRAPPPRFGHATALVEGFLIIHGGMAKTQVGEAADRSCRDTTDRHTHKLIPKRQTERLGKNKDSTKATYQSRCTAFHGF